jgi:hypothetical protein
MSSQKPLQEMPNLIGRPYSTPVYNSSEKLVLDAVWGATSCHSSHMYELIASPPLSTIYFNKISDFRTSHHTIELSAILVDTSHTLQRIKPTTTTTIQTISSVTTTSHTFPSNYLSTATMPIGQQDSGATAGVKFVTSTVGNTVGGLVNTVGGIAGATGRGLGETIEGATGSAGRSVGRAIADGATSLENGARKAASGVKDAGQGK